MSAIPPSDELKEAIKANVVAAAPAAVAPAPAAAAAAPAAAAPAAAADGDKKEKKKDKKEKKEGDAPAAPKMTKEEKMAMWQKKNQVAAPAGAEGDAPAKEKKEKKKEEKPAAPAVERKATKKGEKKDLSHPMESAYNPADVEAAWADWWEAKGFFTPDAEACKGTADGRKFVMVIPPPNVTGYLHIGHTLTASIEDALTRWHRMRGDVALWVPGTDHAGIATQTVVERMLLKTQGITRHDLGREAFLKKVWEWKDQKGDHIKNQFKRLGVSVDWTREAFTMDDNLSRAVKEAFIRMYEKGLIYRDTRLVSWCPHLRTALSDIEVDQEEITGPTQMAIPGFDHKVEVGVLVHFVYKVKGSDETIEVATTRIETMLGDVAVAVHPDDARYKHLHGKELEHPFIKDRKMVVIADSELVDMSFGTGAVKITPAHDPNDYKCGKKHNLEFINVFTEDGKINEKGGAFAGMHRFKARFEIIRELEKLSLFKGKSPNPMRLGICSRSGDIIEPMLLPQWWVNCTDAARRSVEAVRKGDLRLEPKYHEQTWFYWLENIKDWCISRQLWWGHRIPAYKVIKPAQPSDAEVWVVGRDEQEALEKAKEKLGLKDAKDIQLKQDEDVLDTWFSSGLFPFSVFGWPEQTADMEAFFPTSLLETGHDILFFWVARMVMMSLELTDKLPFHTVYLHAMVRDAHGRKMSKSLGNVIDPLEVIEGIALPDLQKKVLDGNLPEKEIKKAQEGQKKDFPNGIPECGADALRFGLLAYTKQGRNINLDINRVVNYRYFCNKLWNATKFALMNFPEGFKAKGMSALGSELKLQWMDEWILHRLSVACKASNEGFETYQFADSVQAAYNFWLYELCDVYLELLKPRLQSAAETDEQKRDQATAREVLYTCLDRGLRLLHPLLPFVTEELYQRIPPAHHKSESICVAPYPTHVIGWERPAIDGEMALFMSVVKQYRSLCANLEVPNKERPAGFIRHKEAASKAFLEQRTLEIATLAKMGKLTVLAADGHNPAGCVADVVSDQCDVFLDPEGSVNLQQTIEKIAKKIAASEKSLEGYVKKMSAADYETKVPEDVRKLNSEKTQQIEEELKGLRTAKQNLEKIVHKL